MTTDIYRDMDLSVLDRLMLAEVLPQLADITTLKMVRVFKEDLSFSQEENNLLQFKPGPDGKGLFWEDDGADRLGTKRVRIPAKVYVILQEKLRELNEKELLTEAHIDLYDRLIEAEKGDSNGV